MLNSKWFALCELTRLLIRPGFLARLVRFLLPAPVFPGRFPGNRSRLASLVPGFTLVELLVTMSIFGLIVMFAIPSFRTMIMNNELAATSDKLVNSLHYARNAALSQAMRIKICPVGAGGTNCGGDWGAGWIVITQPSTGAATLLQTSQMSADGPDVGSTAAEVTFDSHGLATTQSNFTICDSRGGADARSVEVLATGFIQSGSVPGQAVWDNSALVCP
ncbi:GspH/FimT family pseudopilin [Legionella spiritensis]|uniref:Type II secretion system protein H n=1 Tax=Legionella spiritensis TaxID=452 RepID=A0A0W0YX19_LEGSP|nr:GspH/FimT family pseudopilin [Legionella spiritensis]KTD61123.1 type IV pre-pilin [Legionella spiritensis]SNV45042.1 type IV pre-pilin [Legionella spiritensis]